MYYLYCKTVLDILHTMLMTTTDDILKFNSNFGKTMKMLMESNFESVLPGLWPSKIFTIQCEFSWLWQKQAIVQQQACVLSATPMALQTTLTPPAPCGTSTEPNDNEMGQRR